MTEANKVVKGKNLYDKLSKVQGCSQELFKDARNEFQQYDYFTEYQALKLLKPLFDQQGLALVFEDVYEDVKDVPIEARQNKLERVDNVNDKTGKVSKEWLIQYWKKAILIDADKPEDRIEMKYWCMGSNQHISKCKGSAETYGMKYFLTKFFMIPTTNVEDPDRDQIKNKADRPLTDEEKKKVDELMNKHGLGQGDKATGQVEKKLSTEGYRPGLRCNICKSSLLFTPENKRYWCDKCNKETELTKK